MSHYKLLVTERTLCHEFTRLINLGSNHLANWNSNRYGYVSHLFLDSFNQTEDKLGFIKLTLKFPILNNTAISAAYKRSITEPLLGTKYNGACKASSTLRTIISLMELHLISLNILRFKPSYQQNFSITNATYTNSVLFDTLPDLHRCLMLMSTPVSVEQYSDIIPIEWVESYKEHIATKRAYKSQCGVIGSYRRLIFTLGLSDFISLNDDAVTQFRSMDESTLARAYGSAVPFFRQLGSVGLTSEGVAATKANKQASISSAFKDANNNRFMDNGYHIYRGDPKRCCGLSNVVVSIKRVNKNAQLSFGEYEFNDKWASYDLDCFKDLNSPWIKAQREFIKSFHEGGTRNNVNKSLQYLNAYLFHYLKHFFANNDVPYQFPEKISDFKNAIYVAPSYIVTEHLYQSTDVQFPLSIVDWIKISHEDIKDTVMKARAMRISNFFDYVLSKYRGIDGYQIDANPLSLMDLKQIKGQGYNRSNKKIMQLEYWKLFTEFLHVVADQLISNIEEERYIPNTGEFSVDVNRLIEFGDIELHIGNLKNIGFKRCKVKGKNYVQPQIVLAYLIMAKSGLRMANVMNLDVRSYDQYVDNLIEHDASQFIDLYVNTDKAKTSTFTSLLSYSTFLLLKRFVAIRNTIEGVPISPIPYGDSEQSKWGEVIPILAITERNYWDSTLLPTLLNSFEVFVREAGIDLGSEVFYKPAFLSPKSFTMLRAARQRTSPEQYCIHYENEGWAYFTPIEIGSAVTPHSFRKTLDTYYSIIIGDKETGKFFTGQTEATVGYYREATPEVFNQVMSHSKHITLPDIIPVKNVSKDEAEIRRKIAIGGLSGINGFTLSAIETDIKIDLSAVNPSDIAINHTHICIYGNNCPPEILDSLQGKKNCAVCPVSIGTPHDGVAIVAQIKYHVDNIADINAQLKDENLISAEVMSLKLARADELNLACSWFVRHKFIVSEAHKYGDYYVLEDGGEKVKAKLKYMMSSNESEDIYSRLMETKSAPSMQSNKLKQTASRLSRKLAKAMNNGDIDLPDIKPIEMALALIEKVAGMHGIPTNKLNELIKESGNNPILSLDTLLQVGVSDEG